MQLYTFKLIYFLSLQFSTPAYAVEGTIGPLPVTFLTYIIESIDNKDHNIRLYYDNTAEVVNDCITVMLISTSLGCGI